MISLYFSITNPWFKSRPANDTNRKNDYRNLLCKHGKISENKHWEVEALKDRQKILGIEFSLSFKGRDHAGLQLSLCLLGYEGSARIYDVRHWDYETNTWKEKGTM